MKKTMGTTTYKELLDKAVDTLGRRSDERYDKYVKNGMNKTEAFQQSNEDITPFIKKSFSVVMQPFYKYLWNCNNVMFMIIWFTTFRH